MEGGILVKLVDDEEAGAALVEEGRVVLVGPLVVVEEAVGGLTLLGAAPFFFLPLPRFFRA